MTPTECDPQSNPERQSIAEPFTYWRESDGHFLGYLNAYPDHWTQGDDLDDLKAQLLDLYQEFSKEDLPGIRKVGELVVACTNRAYSAGAETS
jgi:predicted RNase H-like HicB family nuclease